MIEPQRKDYAKPNQRCSHAACPDGRGTVCSEKQHLQANGQRGSVRHRKRRSDVPGRYADSRTSSMQIVVSVLQTPGKTITRRKGTSPVRGRASAQMLRRDGASSTLDTMGRIEPPEARRARARRIVDPMGETMLVGRCSHKKHMATV